MKINDEFSNIKITKLVNEGLALTYIEKKTVLILNAIPGDTVKIRIIKKKKKIFFAKVIHIEEKSNFRKHPNCIHSNICGGCIYQDIDYNDQLHFKQEVLNDIIDYNLPELKPLLSPIVACNIQQYHRNKMEFAFANTDSDLVIGLKEKNTFDKVFMVTDCKLMSEESNQLLDFSKKFFSKENLPIWNSRAQTGCLSHLTIRHSKNFDNYMINIKAHSFEECFKIYAKEIIEHFKSVTSVNLLLIHEQKGSPTRTTCIHLAGEKKLKEKIGDLTFSISPLSFFQTNSIQTKTLYDVVKSLVEISPNTHLLDLYCGTGTIGLYVSNNEGNLTGIEEIEDAIDNAKENAALNNIENTHFFSGRVKNILKFNSFNTDIIIVDPPRSGMNPKALKRTAELNCKEIIYVSCNPITLVRDLKELMTYNYKVDSFIPVDMFPHTYHLECVVKLKLN